LPISLDDYAYATVRTYIIELLSKVLYINNELHDITEILLKVALNTLTLTLYVYFTNINDVIQSCLFFKGNNNTISAFCFDRYS
jgi:hypothetical protein